MANTDGKHILTIDLGTSGPKVALFTAGGEILDYEFEAVPLLLSANGGAEQDPDGWWEAIKRAAKKVLAKRLVPVEDIAAICCTTTWSGTIPVDREGRHLTNAILWMDSRGARYIDEITDGLIKIEGYALTKLLTWLWLTGGAPAHSGKDSLAHILYLKNERPEIYSQTHKFLEPKDYLNFRLTGQIVASYDSIILHWVTDNRNIENVVYHPRLLRLAKMDREKLPDLKPAGGIVGMIKKDVAAELGLGEGVQVVSGTPDLQSAAVGSGAVRDYEPHLYVGTSSWLTCHVPFKKTDLFHNIASLPSAIPGRYFIADEQECAGLCLTYLRDNLFFRDDELPTGAKPQGVEKIFDKMAAGVPAGSGKVIFTPWLYGERTPVEDHSVRGGFFNQTLQTTRAHLIRAVLEGVAYNTRWLFGHVEKFAGRRLDGINFIGGGANSTLWCQIYADVLDRTIRQVKDPIQANSRGAAFLAALALGLLKLEDIPARMQIAQTYEPNPANRKIYDELFKEFVNIYERNKAMYARLNRAK